LLSEISAITARIADCLQTRPIDHQNRLVSVSGELEPEIIENIDRALKVVFDII
jgi:mRNA interferase MazF